MYSVGVGNVRLKENAIAHCHGEEIIGERHGHVYRHTLSIRYGVYIYLGSPFLLNGTKNYFPMCLLIYISVAAVVPYIYPSAACSSRLSCT